DLHVKLRETARELAVYDLTVGQLAERFWAANGWRRLGDATEHQYVRERLGLRLSCLKNKRAFVHRHLEGRSSAEGGVRTHLRARPLSVPEPGVFTPRCHAASPAIPVSGG